MDIVLLLARVLLAVVFLVAGVTKLADLKGSRQALRDFGVRAWLAAPGVVLVPLADVAGARGLLVQMLRQQGRLLLRLEALEERMAAAGTADSVAPAQATPPAGLPVGSVAPAFALPGLNGETLTLDFLRAGGKPVLLL